MKSTPVASTLTSAYTNDRCGTTPISSFTRENNMRITIELHWNRRLKFNRRALLSLSAVLFIVAAARGATVVLAHGSNAAPPSPALAASTVVSYQGRVSVNGQPF